MRIEPKLNVFANGLKYLTLPVPESEMTTIFFGIPTGARHESPKKRGIAHFIEHLFFKGCRRYPSPIALNEAVATLGGSFNGATTEEYTYFTIEVPNNFAVDAVDLAYEVLFYPRILKEELTRERKVVFDELLESRMDEACHVEILFDNLMYENQPLGWDVNGTFSTMHALTRSDIMRFFKQWYGVNNMTIIVVGGASFSAVTKRIAKRFGSIKPIQLPKFQPYRRTGTGPHVRHIHSDIPLTYFMVGVPTVPLRSPLVETQKLLDQVYGGSGYSRLYSRIRDQEGLSYELSISSDMYSDAGHTAVFVAAKTREAQKTLAHIVEECAGLVSCPVSAKELRLAKAVLASEIISISEDPVSLAVHYFTYLNFVGMLRRPEEIEASMQAVTLTAIRAFAKRLFDRPEYCLASIGAKPLKLPTAKYG
ncbi:MAG: pitrilysin family protein [Patescibacteria group bacterium]